VCRITSLLPSAHCRRPCRSSGSGVRTCCEKSQTRGYPSGLPSRHAHSRTHEGAMRATEKGGERGIARRVGSPHFAKYRTNLRLSGGVPRDPWTLVSQISRSVCMIQTREGDTLALCLLFGIVALWPLSLSNRRGHDSKLDSLDWHDIHDTYTHTYTHTHTHTGTPR
jgi:hypothetical protein